MQYLQDHPTNSQLPTKVCHSIDNFCPFILIFWKLKDWLQLFDWGGEILKSCRVVPIRAKKVTDFVIRHQYLSHI